MRRVAAKNCGKNRGRSGNLQKAAPIDRTEQRSRTRLLGHHLSEYHLMARIQVITVTFFHAEVPCNRITPRPDWSCSAPGHRVPRPAAPATLPGNGHAYRSTARFPSFRHGIQPVNWTPEYPDARQPNIGSDDRVRLPLNGRSAPRFRVGRSSAVTDRLVRLVLQFPFRQPTGDSICLSEGFNPWFTPSFCARIVPEDVGSGALSDSGDSRINNLRVSNTS